MRLLIDIIDQDAERLPRRLRALGVRFPRAKEEELADRLAVIVQRYSAIAIGDIDIREVLREIFETVYAIGVTLPARWVMLDKTVATLAGVALEISPDFDVFEVARPYAMRLAADRYRPDRIAGRVRADLSALRRGDARLPLPGLRAARRVQGRRRRDPHQARGLRRGGREARGERQPARPRRSSRRRSSSAPRSIAVFAHYADFAGLSLLALPGFIAALVHRGVALRGHLPLGALVSWRAPPGRLRPGRRARATRSAVPEPVAWALVRRGLADPAAAREFLAADGPLAPPEDLAGIAEAADRLARAVRRGEQIAVHGDYDCDGSLLHRDPGARAARAGRARRGLPPEPLRRGLRGRRRRPSSASPTAAPACWSASTAARRPSRP